MRQTTRRVLVQLGVFLVILALLIHVNRPRSSKKTFSWTTIRYASKSTTIVEPRGTCPGIEQTSKPALVVSRVADDGPVEWLDALADKYHLCVYSVDAPIHTTGQHLQVPANRGHEAMAYLTFLIDNYSHLPTAGMVFVHGSRFAWHNDHPEYDNAALLAALNVNNALYSAGYHNLRCDWSASTCSPSYGPPQASLETSMRATLEPWNARAASDTALPRALALLFGGSDDDPVQAGARLLLGRSDALRAQCCAQFVVSRERVLQHSRQEYISLRQWLLDDGIAPRDDRIAGRILSYIWHILFLQQEEPTGNDLDLEQLNTQACPSAAECYCRLYNKCNLDDCSSQGHCWGQYVLPPDFTLPADWAALHP